MARNYRRKSKKFCVLGLMSQVFSLESPKKAESYTTGIMRDFSHFAIWPVIGVISRSVFSPKCAEIRAFWNSPEMVRILQRKSLSE